MAHTLKCEYSKSPVSSCRCSCNGSDHGTRAAAHTAELRDQAAGRDASAVEAEREGDERGAQIHRHHAAAARRVAASLDSDRREHEAAQEQDEAAGRAPTNTDPGARRWTDGAVGAGAVAVSHDSRRVVMNGRQVPLGQQERALTRALVEQPDREFSREELTRAVWKDPSAGSSRMVSALAGQVRSKLDAAGGDGQYVHAGPNGGYSFNPPERSGADQTFAEGAKSAAVPQRATATQPPDDEGFSYYDDF